MLSRLLDGPAGDDELDEYEIVGLSGTSGGAVCALLAWTALREGDRRKARALLDGFWTDNSATTPVDAAANFWLLWASTLQSAGFLPAVSPYDLPATGLDHFRDLLTRRVDFDRIVTDSPDAHPLFLVGAVDVLSGKFRAFSSWREQIVRRHDPRVRRDPHRLPDDPRRGRRLLGRPVLAEPAGARPARLRGRTSCG